MYAVSRKERQAKRKGHKESNFSFTAFALLFSLPLRETINTHIIIHKT
jgi:hypothetical protein